MFCFHLTANLFFVDGSFCRRFGFGLGKLKVSFIFYFLFFSFTNFILFFAFVGWVAMVLTSSSCNLGIDNFDSRQVPNILEFYLLAKEFSSHFILFIYLFYLRFQEPWSRFRF